MVPDGNSDLYKESKIAPQISWNCFNKQQTCAHQALVRMQKI
jgi:hypothetical protein